MWPCHNLIIGSQTGLLRGELESDRSGSTLPTALFRHNQFTQWHSVDGTLRGLEQDSCAAKGWGLLLLLPGSGSWQLIDRSCPRLVVIAPLAYSEPTPLTMSYFPPPPFISDYTFCYLFLITTCKNWVRGCLAFEVCVYGSLHRSRRREKNCLN